MFFAALGLCLPASNEAGLRQQFVLAMPRMKPGQEWHEFDGLTGSAI